MIEYLYLIKMRYNLRIFFFYILEKKLSNNHVVPFSFFPMFLVEPL
jgi:hypothetical protein